MSTLPLRRPTAPALADLAAGTAVREGLLVAGGAGLLALSAQVAVPLPFTPVPLTGQTFAVLLIGAGYGLRRALTTMLVYLAVGLAGVPVFSPDPATGHARTALQILHAPSAGYIVGMILAMGVLGWLTGRSWDRRWRTSIAQMALASVAIYAIGPKGKSTANSLFPKGTDPLLVLDDHGNAFGYAVEHEGSPIPVLLDRRLERLDLTPEERRTALMALDAEEAAQIEAEGERRNIGASILGGIWTFVKRLIVLAIVVVLGALGYWLYYVTSGTNAFDKIGMEINNMVPAAMNEWGCGKLQERFGDTRAPWGCTGADFQSWK